MRLVIIIPTFNEESNVEKICRETLQATKDSSAWTAQVLVVDSNSEDRTQEIVKKLSTSLPIRLLITEKGLGTALKEGIHYAFKKMEAEVVVTLDADFSHSPDDIPNLLDAIEEGHDLVIGSRFIAGGKNKLELHRRILSFGANLTARTLLGLPHIHELTTNFRAFTKNLYRNINWAGLEHEDNTFLPAFIYEADHAGCSIKEVPIIFTDRQFGESKINIPRYVPSLAKYIITTASNNLGEFFQQLLIKVRKPSALILLVILALAALLRFYNLNQTTWFAGDEGRDARVIAEIIETKKPRLQGPPTSMKTDQGRVYYGPGFYYLVMPAFILSGGHPASGAYVIAFLGVLSTLLIFLLTQKITTNRAGLFAASMYAVSPLVVGLERHFWSPNAISFFILLILYSLILIIKEKKGWPLILMGAALGTVWQLHYTALFILIPLGILWWCYKPKISLGNWALALTLFLFVSSPLAISELRHGYPNIKALIHYLTTSENGSYSLFKRLSTISQSIGSLLTNSILSDHLYIPTFLIILGILKLLNQLRKKQHDKFASLLLLCWLLLSSLPHLVYSGEFAFDKRFILYLLPLPFILTAFGLNFIWAKFKIIGKVTAGVVLLAIIYLNLSSLGLISEKAFFEATGGQSLYNRMRATKHMIEQSKNDPVSFSLARNKYYHHAYIYILTYYDQEYGYNNDPQFVIHDPVRSDTGVSAVYGEIGVEEIDKQR